MLILTLTHNLIANRKIGFKTIIIGTSNVALSVYQELENSSKSLGFKFIGYLRVSKNGNDQLQNHLPCLGECNDLEKIITEYKTEEVVIAMDSSEHSQLNDIVNQLEDTSVIIKVIPDTYDILSGSVRMNHIFGTPLIEINPNLMPYWEKVIKRVIDIFVSLLVLTVGCWFYLIIAMLIKITSKGHIFYSQIRIGKNRKPFLIYKFRTMFINSETEGPALSTLDDPRITPFGKFLRKTRVDEFPQFFNVLKGDMALIGPRPERKFYIDKIEKIAPHYKHIHRVKPGITSWGQVKYGYAENVVQMVERLKYDLIYIENMSLALDFKIMFYTILIMLQRRGK